jgi:hypothetical protein
MDAEGIKALSIGTLKAILFQNHVNARLILEKSDLVEKVVTLIEDERMERERKAREEEQEKRAMEEEQRIREESQRQKEEGNGKDGSDSSTKPPLLPPKAEAMAATLQRTGLCVICQDEEANIAIVDCGWVPGFCIPQSSPTNGCHMIGIWQCAVDAPTSS